MVDRYSSAAAGRASGTGPGAPCGTGHGRRWCYGPEPSTPPPATRRSGTHVTGARAMNSLWRPAYVAIGSNLNQPQARVREAFEHLATLPATHLLLRSRLFRTRPMGPQDQPHFVNA